MKVRSAGFYMTVAATVLMITVGARQSLGLYVAPLNRQTGLGIAKISFAHAVDQVRSPTGRHPFAPDPDGRGTSPS